MKYYFDIKLISSKGRSLPRAASEAMQVIHLALVAMKSKKIGISFPEFGPTLGGLIRVHGEKRLLEVLRERISGLPVGTMMLDIKKIPLDCSYSRYERARPSRQRSKLRSGIRSGHITNVREYQKKMCQEVIELPFFLGMSSSTKQYYKRFVRKIIVDEPKDGFFDTFGMSKTASVPEF